MLRTHDNQCIVISGESGAGKTECTKLIVRHLINLARGQQTNKLEDRILEVNPLLEAFGNAQTVMNSNSSRFGKYIELNFDLNGSVIGANISHYLLEKSRIVSHAFAERNFHVFYYLFAGLSSSARSKYKLGAVSDYRYLRACAAPSLSYQQASYVGGPLGTGSNFMTAPEDPIELRKKDAAKFSALTDIMDAIGFKPQQKEDLCTILAVVLHIGNIEFKANEQDNAVISGEKEIRAIAELFSIHIKDISEAITARVTITGGERIRRHVSVEQACEARDAMAKILYQFLFSWIVRLVNKLFAAASVAAMAAAAAAEGGESSSSSSSSSSGKALRPLSTVNGDIKQTSISILDIFGFENFQRNSFEQLCINTANETLQHYFNQHIFKWEQEEYIREGIQYNHVTFVDNQPCVALLMGKPMGILSILDEESHFPKATDETFVGKLMHHFQRSPYVEKHPLQQGSAFVISHYASKVSYSAVLFLEKNRDSVPEGIIDLLRSATDVGLLQEILDTEPSLQAQPEPGSDLELPIQSLDKKKSVSNPTKKRGSLKKLMRKPSVKNVIGSVSKPLDKKRVKATVATSFRVSARSFVFIYLSFIYFFFLLYINFLFLFTTPLASQNSLADLMNKMFACNPHFVRCIKPNAGKVHGAFDPEYCLVQLRYSGVLETIRVRRQGFALRMPFEDFISRYKVAAVNLSDSLSADGEGCTKILSKVVGPEGWEIGVTRVFVKAPQVEILDQVVDDYYKKVVFVQKGMCKDLFTYI